MIIKRPKVSWLGSIYIGTEAEQLYTSLLSILNQKGVIPYEIVLVFDGQVTAEVQTIIINLKKSNDLLNVYKLSENKGLGSALNFGLSKCKGNLIARFDTDDVNHSNRLQSQVKFMDANPQISVLCSSAYEFKSSSKEKFVHCQVRKACYGFLIKYLLSFKNPINHPTVMFRKKDILESKGYPNQKFFEDYLLWLKMRRNKYQFLLVVKLIFDLHHNQIQGL